MRKQLNEIGPCVEVTSGKVQEGDWLALDSGNSVSLADGLIGDKISPDGYKVYRPKKSEWRSLAAGDHPPDERRDILVCRNNDRNDIVWLESRAVRNLRKYNSLTHWLDPGDPVVLQPPLKVGEHAVTIQPGVSVKVGCTTVDAKTVDEIYRRLHANS